MDPLSIEEGKKRVAVMDARQSACLQRIKGEGRKTPDVTKFAVTFKDLTRKAFRFSPY
jgi:hypothetical protein